MTNFVNYRKPLSPLIASKGTVPFAIQYTLDNDLGPNQYEEFWFDASYFVIKESDFDSIDKFAAARHQRGIIYGPQDQEITYPAGTIVIGVSTTEQFRPGEDNDGSPLSNQDTDEDGVPDDLDSDPNDPDVPYPDLDQDGIHVTGGSDSDPDDNDPNNPYPDADQDGFHSNVDPDDTDPNVVPVEEPTPDPIPLIQAEFVILYPEPSIFEGSLAEAIGPGMTGDVYQVVINNKKQLLYIEPGAYKSTGASDASPLAMRGKMRFAVGTSISDHMAWDATETEMEQKLEEMAILDGVTVTVTNTIQDIINGTVDHIEIETSPAVKERIMLWGIDNNTPTLSMIPNAQNGGIPTGSYRYAFKCRTKFDDKTFDPKLFSCFNISQLNSLDKGEYVICRKIGGIWKIIYP